MRDGNISHESARWMVDHARWEHDVYPCSTGWSVVASILASLAVVAVVGLVWWFQ